MQGCSWPCSPLCSSPNTCNTAAPTPNDTLISLRQTLEQLQVRLTDLRNQAAARQRSAAEWRNKYNNTVPRRRDLNDLVIASQYDAAADALLSEARQVETDIESVRAQILQAEKDIAAYNAALANAADKGLVGEAAVEAAKREVENAKTRRVMFTFMGIAVLLLVVAMIWYRIKKR